MGGLSHEHARTRRMVNTDLTEWRKSMKFSQEQAAETLGLELEEWLNLEEDPDCEIPNYVALAMAALSLGCEPVVTLPPTKEE